MSTRSKDPTPSPDISATDLRPQLTDVLDRIRTGERRIITHYGHPLAALVPMSDYWRLMRTDGPITTLKGAPMKRIVVMNLSGGEGKTTVARELGMNITQLGFKVLMIDADPQASLTRSLGLFERTDPSIPTPAELPRSTILQVLVDPSFTLPKPQPAFGMDVIPANSQLSRGDSVLYGSADQLGNLKFAVDEVTGYDFVIIDTTPSRTALLLAAVAAADHVVVPVSSGKGLTNFAEVLSVLETARTINPNTRISAFVQNAYSGNMRHDRELRQVLETQLADVAPTLTPIPHRKAVYNDAMSSELKPVMIYQPRSDAAADLRRMTAELLDLLNVAQPVSVTP
ncbi:type II toxin-antitoxin system prevent-host-death family antitoxin [Deinococcus sp. 6GRE01]|uniref:type II toxin-antitoxin system prevent-host-death family antitoxin n=1 Tax=Deinococcus sp. 6GRE01 TaxID=2745873 RepID=UPI001E4C57AA|nr:type II toxin-antitoxin system prevent-host-death family antitoxin [Deinococcus sp. 6GRE01]